MIEGYQHKGIIVPLSTPLDENEEFSKAGMKQLINHINRNSDDSVTGLFVIGSCGEYPYFDDRESLKIIETVTELNNGKKKIYAGVGRNSTKKTLQIIEETKKLGVDFCVIIPPFYFNIPQSNLVDHYKRLAEESGVPLVLYNLPGIAEKIEISSVEKLSELERIVALKDSSGNLDYFAKVATLLPTFQGNDNSILDSLKLGGVGAVAGLSNIFPQDVAEIYNAYLTGDLKKATELQENLNKKFDIIYKTCSSAQTGVKAALSMLGICSPKMRMPHSTASLDELDKIREFMKYYL